MSSRQAASSLDDEVKVVRAGVGLSRMPHVACVRVGGSGALRLLNRLCPGERRLRAGRVRHTVLLDDTGRTRADVVLGREEDDSFLLLVEGMPEEELVEVLRGERVADASVRPLGESHAVISINGPFAWELLAKLDGAGSVAFPHASLYRPATDRISIRAGKTGEYGYDLVAPRATADDLWAQLVELGVALDAAVVGVAALWCCSLENWFFNIHREGREELTPVELGIGWRLASSADYRGADAVRARRAAGETPRATPFVADTPLPASTPITFAGQPIGRVLHSERSPTLGLEIGIALLERPYAYSGIERYRASAPNGIEAALRTVSAPFIDNLSLHVSPHRDVYARRAEVAFAGPVRRLPARRDIARGVR